MNENIVFFICVAAVLITGIIAYAIVEVKAAKYNQCSCQDDADKEGDLCGK